MIDGYKFGEIIIDGKKYTSDIIIFPDRVNSSWWRKDGHKLQTDDIQEILDAKPETLIVGTGKFGMMKLMQNMCELMKSLKIEIVALKTEEACKEYNLLKDLRRVVAALHLTC
jgi:hypothetical protein